MAELRSTTRRRFIRTALYSGAAIWLASRLPYAAIASEPQKKITILNTNDTHSRIEPFPMDGGRNQGLGGFSRRGKLIESIRGKEKNVLLLDAGDTFQGTPYFNFFGGELEFKLMTEMGYDASTIGNHEFDNGIENLATQIQNAGFPFICSNYDFSETPLNGKTIKNKIFVKDDIRIGVYGLGIELTGLVPDKLIGGTKYLDPIETAKSQEAFLKHEEKCDLIICISHLGFEYESNKISDIKIAQNTEFTNLILGGHSHTFMNQPLTTKNLQNDDIYIFQVGWAGINLGRIDFTFNKQKKPKMERGGFLEIS